MTRAGGTGSGVMAGGGSYLRHSGTQEAAAARGLELVAEAVADLPAPAGVPRVADLGCAQGHNSLAPMAAAVTALRARWDRDVEVVHTDLPGNDWATLFAVVEHDPQSYLRGAEGAVHPSAVGRSFYERLVADGALHLAWCSSALHWLSAPPGPVADHFFVQLSTDAPARERYRARAAADWTAFLAHRARELVPGGSVVFVDVLMGDDGSMGAEPLFDKLEDALRAARDAGSLTGDEYAALAYPTWFRDLAELRAPFGDGGPLELVALEPSVLADPFMPALRASGDAGAYGRAQAGFLRAFLEPSFRAALAGRGEEEAQEIMDAVFGDAATRIAADPGAVSPAYRLVSGRIRRT